MSRISIGCLSWLTDSNTNERSENWHKSVQSLNLLKQQDCDLFVINNGGIKTTSKLVNDLCSDVKVYDLSKNYFDVAVHVCTMLHALKNNNEFMMYTYDDIVFTDSNFIDDCLTFFDYSREISCMRISKFMYDDKRYNALHTPKHKNPEAVRLNNTAKHAAFYAEGPVLINKHEFYKTNLRSISRPTIWRTDKFVEFLADKSSIPVMQPFESYMYNLCDAQANWISSFIQGGVCHTFAEKTSSRMKHKVKYWDEQFISLVELKEDFYASMS